MDFVTTLLDWIASLPDALLVTATGVLVFAETTIGLGFLAPGESGLLVAATSVRGVADFVVLWSVVTLCAGIGDSIGYAIGRRFGPLLRQTKLIQKYGIDAWDKATDLLRRRGAWAVFFARFLPVVRTLTPAAAGTSKLPFRKFIPAVVAGTMCWSALHIGLGAALGEAAKRVEDALSTGGAIVVGIGAVVLVILLVRFKRKRAATRSSTQTVAEEPAERSAPVERADAPASGDAPVSGNVPASDDAVTSSDSRQEQEPVQPETGPRS